MHIYVSADMTGYGKLIRLGSWTDRLSCCLNLLEADACQICHDRQPPVIDPRQVSLSRAARLSKNAQRLSEYTVAYPLDADMQLDRKRG